MKTDNKYNRKNINSYEDAIEFIKKDFPNKDTFKKVISWRKL